jgi:hypothetical protein
MDRTERNKKYYEEHKEERKIYLKNYREKNREKILSQKKEHWDKNKHEINEKRKEWRSENKDKISIQSKKYYEKNKTKIREYQNEYEINRKQKDFSYRLRINLRARIREAIKNNGTKKSYSTIFLIGCEVDYLRQHLESQFKTGMSWSNYGEWEIDHIQPCSSFDLTNEQQQKECFHYTNLQPLWKTENRIKGARTA